MSHPLRSSRGNATVLDIASRFPVPDPHDDIDRSVATLEAVGDMLDKMQTRIETQAAQIAGFEKEVRDLAVHKEAAYSEMTRSETALRIERERADRAERLCQQLTASEREAQEKMKRLIQTVKSTFSRAEQMAAAAAAIA